MKGIHGNGITNRIVDYFYNHTEQGVRELMLNSPLELLYLTPDFPYYDEGIRILEFKGNRVSKLYVSLSFLSNKDFVYYYRQYKIIVIDYTDYNSTSTYFLFPNLEFIDIKDSGLKYLPLCMSQTNIYYDELRGLDYDIINLYYINNPNSTHLNEIDYSFSKFTSNKEYDYDKICENFMSDLNYLFNQFSISGSFKVHLDGLLKPNTSFLLFLSTFLISFEGLDESFKLVLKNHLEFVLYDSKSINSLKYLNPDFYNKFKNVFKCSFR